MIIYKKFLTYFTLVFLGITTNLCPTASANEISSAAKEQAQILQRTNLTGTPYQLGLEIADLPPYSTKPPHRHTGPELVYVLAGGITLMLNGQPAKRFNSGESFQTPPNTVHVTTAGPEGAKVLAIWAVKQGEPLSIPVS